MNLAFKTQDILSAKTCIMGQDQKMQNDKHIPISDRGNRTLKKVPSHVWLVKCAEPRTVSNECSSDFPEPSVKWMRLTSPLLNADFGSGGDFKWPGCVNRCPSGQSQKREQAEEIKATVTSLSPNFCQVTSGDLLPDPLPLVVSCPPLPSR